VMQPPVPIGSVLAGKYRIERVIGQGGMGVVVAAVHDELDQRVAIKFLSPEGAKGSEWISRFAREAKAAAKIKNEHAVKVFDVGKLESGIPYMVMEFLEGENFDEILERRGTFPLEEAADCLLQACEALAEAHLVGIVHRDLKPANLFLAHKGDGTARVKILDFGISKVDETLAIGGAVTHTTSLVGSPLYMSPERLRGAKDVDRRADIWSLGVILQEMLTGTTPFVADTIPDIHALVLTTPPTPLHKGYPAASQELEDVVRKCLQKAPEDRFQNVLELATAIAAIVPAVQPSVDRIAHIAVGGSGPRARLSSFGPVSASVPPASVPPASRPSHELVATAAATSGPARESQPSPPPAAQESLKTVSATGTLGDALKRSSGRVALAAAALAAVIVMSVVVLRLRTTRPSKPPTIAKAPATATANATVTATATATADVEESPSATAEAAASETPSAPRVVPVRRHRRRAPAPSARGPASAAPSAPQAPPPTDVIDYGGRN